MEFNVTVSFIALVISIIGLLWHFVTYFNDRSNKIELKASVKIHIYYPSTGENLKKYIVGTITNKGKQTRTILNPSVDINGNGYKVFELPSIYSDPNETTKFPYKLEPGDQIYTNFNIKALLEGHQDTIEKFGLKLKVSDTIGKEYYSKKLTIDDLIK